MERVERHLRAALAEVNLDNTHRAQVEEFIDDNELAVAFEWIVGVLAELRLAIPDGARQHSAAAAAELRLETTPIGAGFEVAAETVASG